MKRKEYAKVYKIRGNKRNKLKVKLYTSLLNQEVYNSTKKVISRKPKYQLYIDID